MGDPFYQLWTLACTLEKPTKQWLRGPMFKLDPAKVELDMNSIKTDAQQLHETFQGLEYAAPANVADQLQSQVSVLLGDPLALVTALCNKGLRPRHWKQISILVGFCIEPSSVLTLSRVIDMEVAKYLTKLRTITEAATEE